MACPVSATLIETVRQERRLIRSPDPSESVETAEDDLLCERESVLCIPIIRNDHYYGCVYLANTLVVGLFSDSACKAAEIIAVQAGFLIENWFLLDNAKRFTELLEQKVRDQTADIRAKNEQLSTANLKLVESERMKNLLTNTIVHDIKNFAAGISGNMRLLSYKHQNDQRTLRSIELVVESCTDIVNLSSNLLDISKMEEGRLMLNERNVYFEELAAICQKYGKSILLEEKHISVTIVPPHHDFVVMADPYLVERIIQNLFSNAAKYTSGGGRVVISFEEREQENVVTFMSSAPVIPADQKEVIFEKYSRVDGKQTPYSKGLGLFFCKMVMDAHGGRIWLDTDEENNYFRLGFKKR